MTSPFTLFELSFEVCNKVGGIHTVLSSKARTLVNRMGDDYIAVGPWLLSAPEGDVPFDADPTFSAFEESCRRMGVPVRVGRWRIPSAPRTILVEFSGLYDQKDELLAELWEDFGVDSIHGDWDYVEPVLFGHAAARVIERWWEEYLASRDQAVVVHAHEWMTGSALLYLEQHVPAAARVFTTHATMLGRALASVGIGSGETLAEELEQESASALAEAHGVQAKHSLEGIVARHADVFTTVSEITAEEATLLHGRAPSPVTPNGIDLEVIDALAGEAPRETMRAELQRLAARMLGEDVGDAAFLATSGRYEFHNKGFDVLLEALADMNERKGRRVVCFLLAPAGNTGIRSEYLERLRGEDAGFEGPLGISTHNLFDEENDPVHRCCADLGLDNTPGSRVRVIQIPIYLSPTDDLLGRPYEAVLRAMDATVFPSYYEPWGYTPQESIALGVPTVTTDLAGFGRWALAEGLTPSDGVHVVQRHGLQHDEVSARIADALERLLAEGPSATEGFEACRRTARRTDWSGFIKHYDEAYAEACRIAGERAAGRGRGRRRRPPRELEVVAKPAANRPHLHAFDVSASLPPRLVGLQRLARNYWWSWDPEGSRLFEDLSPLSWSASDHNPLEFLARVWPEDLERASEDEEFHARLVRVLERFDAYLAEPQECARWRSPEAPEAPTPENPVAYFCAEYGLHESLRIYSGGLGILAGDHLKSASDLNLPFVAVGLFYRNGYMGQRLSPSAEQVEVDVENDPSRLPMSRVLGRDGEPLRIQLNLPGRRLSLCAWRVDVGRVPLYLLDTNLPENRVEDRDITRHLYGGDQETRLQQEIVLGRGGVRLLRELGIEPSVYHMNEGHAAFLTMERARQLTHSEGLTFDEAREAVRATTLFTTHTPVPAGHDRFDEDLMRRYFSDVSSWAGVPWETFWALGGARGEERSGSFNMTYLAMNFASFRNGVSKLHGIASRKLFRPFWPERIESEIPVGSVTNGIHLPTWTAPELAALLGASSRPVRPEDFSEPPRGELLERFWRTKQEKKRELLEAVRLRTRRTFVQRGDSPLLLDRTLAGLDDDALVLGFARRFAPYKRADLMFRDEARLRAILSDEERPVRILIAGKAHPRDQRGKDILHGIAERTRRDDFAGRVLFLEDYDIELARLLMAGVDVWMNTPTRMLEASGTSGMKAAANGGLNLSVGDGWWPEAADGKNGWMIDRKRSYDDQELQDELDASHLYRLLEEEVVPEYFERDEDGLPRAWLERVAHCLATVPTEFNTDRMVLEYTRRAYTPLSIAYRDLSADHMADAKRAVAEEQRARRGFEQVEILSASMGDLTGLAVGDTVDLRLEARLGPLSPEDVIAELVIGHATDDENLDLPHAVELPHTRTEPDGRCVFEGRYAPSRSGRFRYGLRIRDRLHGDFIAWA